MSHIIKHLHIEKLFGTTNIDWELNPSVNVLVGQNGLGKSTILRIVEATLLHSTIDELQLMNKCKLQYLDGTYNTCQRVGSLHQTEYEKALTLINRVDNLRPIFESKAKIKNDSFSDGDTLDELKLIKSEVRGILSKLENYKNIMSDDSWFTFDGNKKTNIEYISTINLSANSINEIITSSGKHTNFLDFEISNEVQRLLAFNDDSLKENLLSALNNLFAETQKTIEFNEKNSTNKLLVKLSNGEEIPFNKLSSGERQVIFIFLKVVIASVDGALILMDEPEISLHLSWQEKLLNEIRRINTSSQIIIVTHSPAMLMNGWMDSFVDIANIMTDVSNNHPSE